MRIVDAQMDDMSRQMAALDDFVTKARSRNGDCNGSQLSILNSMSTNVHQSCESLDGQLEGFGNHVKQLESDYSRQAHSMRESGGPAIDGIGRSLSQLGRFMRDRDMKEYEGAGKMPEKRQYQLPSVLPKTEDRGSLLARLKTASG